MALESAILISSIGSPSPRGMECDEIQAKRPSLGVGAAKEVTRYSPFGTTYVTSISHRCYHVCYHTDLLHKKMVESEVKVPPSREAVTGREDARPAPDTASPGRRHRAQSPRTHALSRRMRARSPRAGSEPSFRSSRGRCRLHGKGRGDQAAGFPDRPSALHRGVDNRRAPAASQAPRDQ